MDHEEKTTGTYETQACFALPMPRCRGFGHPARPRVPIPTEASWPVATLDHVFRSSSSPKTVSAAVPRLRPSAHHCTSQSFQGIPSSLSPMTIHSGHHHRQTTVGRGSSPSPATLFGNRQRSPSRHHHRKTTYNGRTAGRSLAGHSPLQFFVSACDDASPAATLGSREQQRLHVTRPASRRALPIAVHRLSSHSPGDAAGLPTLQTATPSPKGSALRQR